MQGSSSIGSGSSSRWTADDRIRIVMESLTTNITLAELCRKYNLKPNVFYNWKQKFMEGGKLALTGSLPEKETPLNASSLINARRSLAGSVIGGIRETQEMLNFCSKHNIASDIELIPIQGVNEAYPRIVSSDVRYRFVIDTKSLDLG